MKGSFVFAILVVALLAVSSAKSNNRFHRRGRHWSTRANLTVGERLKKWSKKPQHERLGYPHEQGADIYHEFDIMLAPGQDANGVSLSNKPNSRWPNAVVPYVIAGSLNSLQISIIQTAMGQFASTTCVRFVPRTDESLFITINNNGTGCWAYVGRNLDNSLNIVNLQTPDCITTGTVAHELMHAIGFEHEVSRPDRDDWITVDLGALSPENSNQGDQFEKLSPAQVELYGIPYNYGSVMHYSKYAGAASETRPVLVNTKPWNGDFGSTTGLTAPDVAAINAMYCGGSSG